MTNGMSSVGSTTVLINRHDEIIVNRETDGASPSYEALELDIEATSLYQVNSLEDLDSDYPYLSPPRVSAAADASTEVDLTQLDAELNRIVQQASPRLPEGFPVDDIYAAFGFIIQALLEMFRIDSKQMLKATELEVATTHLQADAIREEGDAALSFGVSRGVLSSAAATTGAYIKFKGLGRQKDVLRHTVPQRQAAHSVQRHNNSESLDYVHDAAMRDAFSMDAMQQRSSIFSARRQVTGDALREGGHALDTTVAGVGENSMLGQRAEARIDEMESQVAGRTSQTAGAARDANISLIFQIIGQLSQIFNTNTDVAAHVAQKT